ncbi:hypothetical protein ACQR35_13470 [Pseudarthrobacter sp. J1738]|uniref:hypothetical protein n=1 Tax=Pseudarthrobacter sp. J1738 TaxID=3420446 RepID=UPI003D2E105C
MITLTGVELLSGAVPACTAVAAAAAALFLLIRRRRRWWMATGGAFLAAALLAAGTGWVLVHAAGVSAQELPLPVTVWMGLAYWAVLLAGLNLAGSSRRRRILAPVAMTALILVAALQVNVYYAAYRTLGDMTGASTAAIGALPQAARAVPRTMPGPAPGPKTGPVASTWVKPPGLPAAGTISSVQIPVSFQVSLHAPGTSTSPRPTRPRPGRRCLSWSWWRASPAHRRTGSPPEE